jgi:invasion protein IalB
MSERISWLMMVPYACLLVRMCEGWQPAADLGVTHGEWSVLCEWKGEDEP